MAHFSLCRSPAPQHIVEMFYLYQVPEELRCLLLQPLPKSTLSISLPGMLSLSPSGRIAPHLCAPRAPVTLLLLNRDRYVKRSQWCVARSRRPVLPVSSCPSDTGPPLWFPSRGPGPGPPAARGASRSRRLWLQVTGRSPATPGPSNWLWLRSSSPMCVRLRIPAPKTWTWAPSRRWTS